MVHPRILRSLCGFDPRLALLLQVLDTIGNPVDVLFDGGGHVDEYRRAPGAVDREQVREASHLDAEESTWTLCPGVGQTKSVASLDIDPQQGASHRVEAGG